jgi:endonuclease YncB( thermonuclease family)
MTLRGLSVRLFALLLVLGTLGTAPEVRGQAAGDVFTGRVVRIVDGDTYEVRRSRGEVVTVRLFGVDAPESGQPYSTEAAAAARRYVGGARVRVRIQDIGPYDRLIGRLTVQGTRLARLLVRDGLAWHADRYAPDATQLARLERQARNAGRGLWSRSDPIPPWDWRDGERPPPPSSAPAGLPYDPNGPDRDCSDFRSQEQAQRFFEAAGPGDPHRLDGDDDGQACESL